MTEGLKVLWRSPHVYVIVKEKWNGVIVYVYVDASAAGNIISVCSHACRLYQFSFGRQLADLDSTIKVYLLK